VTVIGGVVILEARPVYGYLASRAFSQPNSPVEMILGFAAAAVLCTAATVLPVREALRRLEKVER
jgi:hypothetical protein